MEVNFISENSTINGVLYIIIMEINLDYLCILINLTVIKIKKSIK